MSRRRNIYIEQGATFRLYARILEEQPIVASAAAAGATTLTVEPLKTPLAIGNKIAFGTPQTGENIITVVDSYSLGATSITLADGLTYALSAAADNLTGYKIRNCTGHTGRAQIRSSLSASGVLQDIVLSLENGEEGLWLLPIDKLDTALIPANIDRDKLVKLLDENKDIDDSKLQARNVATDYPWDFEIEDEDGVVDRAFWGYAVVAGEATR